MPKISVRLNSKQQLVIESEGEFNLEQALFMLTNACLYYMRMGAAQTPTPEFKNYAYDVLNQYASAALEKFAPEIELRPDLNAEAILRAQNEIIQERVSALQEPVGTE